MSDATRTVRDAFAQLGLPRLVLADIGARGEVPEPWDALGAEVLQVIGFEPDADECRRLNDLAGPDRRFLPVALWNAEGIVDVHLASTPSCSSVHPPNYELLARYAAQHGRPRDTERTIAVPATTLDATVASDALDVDFLKVDTQGAEYEILDGARETLSGSAIGALVETWTTEVHRGQHLAGDVMTLMNGCGFELFDVGIAAAWRRRIVDTTPLLGKPQIVGLDLLFFCGPAHLQGARRRAKAAKLAAIAAIYGFPDFALEVIGDVQGLETLRTAIRASATPTRSTLGARARSRARHLRHGVRRAKGTYPSLHT